MSSINLTCDVCGREVFSCTFVNGMKFCAKCYQETFGETDKDRKIADLEAKLAESEKKAYSRGHSQRDIANEIKLNALREDVANKEKRIVELKQQLEKSEKSKESYRLQNEQHHLQLLQFYSRLGVEAFGADIHEKALETLMIMKEELEEKNGVRRALSACNHQNDEFADMIKKLVNEKEKLKQQLHDLPKKIVEEIRDDMSKRIMEKQIKWGDNIQIGFICNAINECLDTILKKFGGEDE